MTRHHLLTTTATIAGASLFMLAPATAQDSAQDSAPGAFVLDEITVSANLAPTPRDRTGTSVGILTEDELDKDGDVQLSDHLARLPGVSTSRQGPVGAASNLRIRGADRRYIAVYFDGIRIDDPSLVQTGTDFGPLTTAGIGRVEVLRGSQSALYGGSAVGGVVDISSRRPQRDGISQTARIEGGSFGTLRGEYTLSQRDARGEATLSLSHIRSDGFSAADENDGNTEADGFESTRIGFNTRYAVSDRLTLGAAAFVQESEVEYDGFVFDPATFTSRLTDLDNVQDRREGGARVFAEWEAGRSTHQLEATAYRIRRINDEENTMTGGRDINRFRGTRLGLGYQGTTEIGPDFTMVYGADLERERARYDNLSGGSRSTRFAGVFAQALWAPGEDLDVSATARFDDNSDFGSELTGRLAVAWQATPSLTLRGVAATGFRPPSLDERFGVYGSFSGNPDLEPETSRSFELGAEQEFAGGARIGATLFDLQIRNLVQTNASFTSLENVPGKSRRRGAELMGEVPIGGRVTLGAAYTYTSARAADGDRLGQVPRHDLTLNLDAAVTDRLTAGLSIQHVADRPDDGFPAQSMSDYTVANARFGYDISDNIEATLRIDNIFDEQYQSVAGFGTPDRSVFVGLSSRF